MAAGDGAAAAEGSSGPGPVSFAFSRRAERRRPLPAGPCAEPGAGGDSESDTELLTAVEDRELLGTRPAPPPKKELVIPLIPTKRWPSHAPSADHAPKTDHAPTTETAPKTDHAPKADHAPGTDHAPSVEAQAVQELLQEARQSQESNGDSEPPMAIAMAAPDRERDRERDSAVGTEPTPQDYAAVPVGQFGLAMLRGMGWSQGQGIGRTFPRVVAPQEHKPRPRGLGLGAQAAPPGSPQPQGTAGIGLGESVAIAAGAHRGLRGKVEALDPETGRAVVRLQLGGQLVTVSQHGLSPVCTGAPKPAEDSQRGERKRKEKPESERQPKHSRALPSAPHWLRQDLRVRCVDRAFRGGRYYNCKMQIEDLLAADSCVCRTEDGRVVEGVPEASLETVVPRGDSERILVVLGEHRGKVGRVLQRQPQLGTALVELRRDETPEILQLSYDCICQYLGAETD